MTGNPFDYQRPIDPGRLIDRQAELHALARAAASHVAVRLAAPRRYGKSSLLRAHLHLMQETGHRAVRVDFSRVAGIDDVAVRVAEAYAALPDVRGVAARWAERLQVQIGAAPLRVTASPPARWTADSARAALLELLDVPDLLHRQDGVLTVVAFDEFQDLLLADPSLDGLFRSRIQHHGEGVTYVFAGSEPSLMRAMFTDRARPFFDQARPVALPPLPFEETYEDVLAMFAPELHEVVGRPLTVLLDAAEGHPQRSTMLAHHLFEAVDEGLRDDLADAALERVRREVEPALQATWDGLGRTERLVLRALAEGRAPTGSQVAAAQGVSRSTLSSALERLVDAGQHVHRVDGSPRLIDPLLGDWVRRARSAR